MLNKEQRKDLRPMKANELELGGVFFLQVGKEFHQCQIFPEEVKIKERADQLRNITQQMSKEGRLFVRINKPFKSFAE